MRIRFADRDQERRAIGLLMGRFPATVLAGGEHLLPAAALSELAERDISFAVVGRPGPGKGRSATDDYGLLASAVRALWGSVTPDMRAVSVEADPDERVIRFRFVFDGPPSESAVDAAQAAATELVADFDNAWSVDEQHVVRPAPEPMAHLRRLLYHRCEATA